ncbi:MAG: thioredoxin family protein [Thermodesulfobacteriota bacterium]
MGEEITKIIVSGRPVGIVGLPEIFQVAKEKIGLREVEMERFLLEEAKKKNYIPAKVEGEYARSLMREFKKFRGEKVEENFSGLQVQVLGPGCPNCQRLERETLAALAELNLEADFSHIQDLREIAQYGARGIVGTPALLINGQVKCVGRVPSKDQIKKWLLEAKG